MSKTLQPRRPDAADLADRAVRGDRAADQSFSVAAQPHQHPGAVLDHGGDRHGHDLRHRRRRLRSLGWFDRCAVGVHRGHGHARGRDRGRRGGRNRRRRGGRARKRSGDRVPQRQSVHHHAWDHGAGARHRVSHHRRCAGERRDRAARRLRRLRLRPPPRHPLSGLGAGAPPGRAVLRHACHPLRPARLRHRRRAGGRVPVGRAGAPGDRLDLCLVRRARRRRRRDARRPVAVGPADRRRVLRIDRDRGRGAGRGRAPGRRRHALQERDRGLHHDRARQRAQSAQCRFLLAARGGGRRDHCGGRRREATLAGAS